VETVIKTTEVEPGSIESGLKTLKAENAAQSPVSERIIKAAVANIIVVGDASGSNEAFSVVSRIAQSFPVKIFLISSSSSSKDLRSEIGLLENRVTSDELIQSELVKIVLGKDRVNGLPSLLFGSLSSDVPLMSLILGDFCGDSSGIFNEIVVSMSEDIDRVIFDSSTAQCLQETISDLGKFGASFGKSSEGFSVYDLSWTRLERFRDIVVEMFDTDRVADPLSSISELRLSYSGWNGLLSAEAALAVKWIFSCLGWRSTDRATVGRVTCVKKDGSPAVLRVVNQLEEKGVEQSFRVEFICEDGERAIRAVKRQAHWEFQVVGLADESLRMTSRTEPPKEEMIVDTLFSARPDPGPGSVVNELSSFLKNVGNAGS